MITSAAIRWLGVVALALVTSAAPRGQPRTTSARPVLRVCADPNNMPFSNQRGEGFENRIAQLIAHDMNARVAYTWWAQRRGFIRNTLNASVCDLVMGVPASFDLTAVTEPYYRSTYVFVTRRDRNLRVRSFDDPRLRRLRIGVQLVGDDGYNTPPVHALGARGMRGNLKGYPVYGDYSRPNPTSGIIEAVAKGEVEVAIAWGPIAGYFAKQQRVPLELVPVSPQIDLPFMPQVFDIAIGVRRQDKALRDQLDRLLAKERVSIAAILDDYGVPRLASQAAPPGA